MNVRNTIGFQRGWAGRVGIVVAVGLTVSLLAGCNRAPGLVAPRPMMTRAAAASPAQAPAPTATRVPSRPPMLPPLAVRNAGDGDWMARFGAATEAGQEEVARAVDFDRNGAVYAVGTVAPRAVLATSSSAVFPETVGLGGSDGFVAVFNAGGALRWMQTFGGPGQDYAYDVAADRDDGAWVCGTFTATASFGVTQLVAAGDGPNGFAFHVSPHGSIGRVLHVGSSPGVIPGECVADASGGLIVTGSYSGAAQIGEIVLPSAPAGQTAGFIAVYAADGQLRWAQGVVAGIGLAWRGVAVAADGSGDVLGIGQFRGALAIGLDTFVASGNGAATWIARWSADGQPRWARSPAGESYGRGIQALDGDIVVSGAFRGNLQWPGLGPVASKGGQDLFAARLTGAGTAVWSRAVGGSADDEGAEIAVDASGAIYLGGSFAGSVDLGGAMAEAAGARDLLIARLDRNGTLLDGRAIGGAGDDVTYALDTNPEGWIAYAGFGRGSVGDGVRNMSMSGSHDALIGVIGSASPPNVQIAGIVSTAVNIPQRGGGSTLAARVYAPGNTRGRFPILSLLPGGGAPIDSVTWAAEGLAAKGYVVIVTQPSSGGSLSAYHTAAVSGIDFLQSAANPYASISDGERVGVAGWSLGARALSRTQEEDGRVDALVAWDNLAVYETGDVGSPNCVGSVPAQRRTPRVPAMGQASDYCGPPGESVEDKKTAYAWWRSQAKPTMQIVLAGSDHFVWGSQGNGSARQGYALYYSAAWFDRWLKNDSSARTRLFARSIDGQPVESILSTRFRSAASFDARNCQDLRSGCQ